MGSSTVYTNFIERTTVCSLTVVIVNTAVVINQFNFGKGYNHTNETSKVNFTIHHSE